MNEIIGLVLMAVSLIFILIGSIGLFRFKNFYSRILIASLIDTAGFICMMFGVMVYKGFSYFSLKVFLILFAVLLLNPVSTHFITKSAHYSGYHVKKGD
ncbi:monovalent cation/H(+) antiporter subunit G [Vallitalea okinawensis]|uniref:monovalent cation/H(+) antiporter subunit G n=1 Tax=Vallitalea okinawensis TaxID=2078660 RepID=UPI000CFD2F38|nr:monovalent cation/H(+) antiporter subunit G [Vallitalea okinawensis]